MAEEYLGIREFDGFASAIRLEVRQVATDTRGEVRLVADQVTQVSSKIDTLVTARIEEARMMGEIRSDIRAIRERQQLQERSIRDIEKSAEEREASFRGEIEKLWENDDDKSQGKLKWWGQMALLILSTIFGGWVARTWK